MEVQKTQSAEEKKKSEGQQQRQLHLETKIFQKEEYITQLNEINKLIWPSPGGIGAMDEVLWGQTVKVATEEGILTAAPTDGAFRTDLAEEALANLRDAGVDVIGDDWTPVTVELREGGE